MATEKDDERSVWAEFAGGMFVLFLLAVVLAAVSFTATYCTSMIKADRGEWYHWLGMSVISGLCTFVFMLLSGVSQSGRNNSGTNTGLALIAVMCGLSCIGSLVGAVSTGFGWS